MRKFEVTIATDLRGSECSFDFEVEDDATDAEIEDGARETAFEHIYWSYKEITS